MTLPGKSSWSKLADLMSQSDSKKSTYEPRVKCGNCGYEGRIKIPKGRQIEVHECPECGCKRLVKAMWG